jgi:hypothetical protein
MSSNIKDLRLDVLCHMLPRLNPTLFWAVQSRVSNGVLPVDVALNGVTLALYAEDPTSYRVIAEHEQL